MTLRTKLHPMGGGGGDKYVAYLVRSSTSVIDVKTLGFNEPIKPDKCFGSKSNICFTNYVILNGKLFYYDGSTLSQVGSDSTWTAITGYSRNGTYGYGINNGRLYKLTGTTATQVGSLTGWQLITGDSTAGVGAIIGTCVINNNIVLMKIDNTTVSNITSNATGWTDIEGLVSSGSSSSVCNYGLANGYLYYFTTGVNKMAVSGATSALWSNVTMTSPGAGYAVYNGKLYYLSASTATTKASYPTGFTDIAGSYGIASGSLYSLSNTSATKVGTATNWTKISGQMGICGGNLYYIGSNNSQTKLKNNCVKIMGRPSTYYPALAICEK